MNLTLTTGIREMEAKFTDHLGKVAEALSKGLLMGARGNSGVIFPSCSADSPRSARSCRKRMRGSLPPRLQQGVDTAYRAVVKPVEGTVLTVSKEAASGRLEVAQAGEDRLIDAGGDFGSPEALARTPEQLPILKQVGVVDAGGQGLASMYEGFVQALIGEIPAEPHRLPLQRSGTPPSRGCRATASTPRQAQLSAENRIRLLYRVSDPSSTKAAKAFIRKRPSATSSANSAIRLSSWPTIDLVKVHIHAEYPGDVLNRAMKLRRAVAH